MSITEIDSSLADKIGYGPVGDRPPCRAVIGRQNILDVGSSGRDCVVFVIRIRAVFGDRPIGLCRPLPGSSLNS
jgi:hypothetical protein